MYIGVPSIITENNFKQSTTHLDNKSRDIEKQKPTIKRSLFISKFLNWRQIEAQN